MRINSRGACEAALTVLLVLGGCAGPGQDGKTVWVLNLAPSPCVESQQTAKSAETTFKQAADLEITGKLTSTELVKIRDTIYLLHGQSQQACDFFNRGRINFDQYKGEMREVREGMLKVEELVANKSK